MKQGKNGTNGLGDISPSRSLTRLSRSWRNVGQGCLESHPPTRQRLLVDETSRYNDLWPRAKALPVSAMLTREQNGTRVALQ